MLQIHETPGVPALNLCKKFSGPFLGIFFWCLGDRSNCSMKSEISGMPNQILGQSGGTPPFFDPFEFIYVYFRLPLTGCMSISNETVLKTARNFFCKGSPCRPWLITDFVMTTTNAIRFTRFHPVARNWIFLR